MLKFASAHECVRQSHTYVLVRPRKIEHIKEIKFFDRLYQDKRLKQYLHTYVPILKERYIWLKEANDVRKWEDSNKEHVVEIPRTSINNDYKNKRMLAL